MRRNWRKITFSKLWDYLIVTNIQYGLWYFCAYFPFFPDLMLWKIRPMLWRWIGVSVGKDVFIGYGVYLDIGGAKRIKIGNNVIITSQAMLLTHKRDMQYYTGRELQNELPFKNCSITLCDNCSIGMRSIIMPGVTIGEGAVVGAYSVVSKNIPSKVIAVGNPIRIIKEL